MRSFSGLAFGFQISSTILSFYSFGIISFDISFGDFIENVIYKTKSKMADSEVNELIVL